MDKLKEVLQSIPPPVRMVAISAIGVYLAHHGVSATDVDQFLKLITQMFFG